MPTIRLTDETYRLLKQSATLPFKGSGEKTQDGDWEVPVSDDVVGRLEQHALPGESIDQTVSRVIRKASGHQTH